MAVRAKSRSSLVSPGDASRTRTAVASKVTVESYVCSRAVGVGSAPYEDQSRRSVHVAPVLQVSVRGRRAVVHRGQRRVPQEERRPGSRRRNHERTPMLRHRTTTGRVP
jgi:hypothetical protein